MPLPIHDISIQGPSVQLEELIQLRHAAKKIRLNENIISQRAVGGHNRSAFRGRGMDFEEVRIYQAGDDIRSIDWRVTARTAKTHTKVFREEKEQPVFLAVDQSSSMFFGSKVTYKSVMATELAALLAWSTLQHHDKIGGIVFNEYEHAEIKPKRSKHALLGFLKKMANFNQQLFDGITKNPNFSLHTLFEKLRYLIKPGSTLFIISDFANYDAEAERLLYLVKRHTVIHALVVIDSMEEKLPLDSKLSITDGIHKRFIDTHNREISENYQEAFQKKQRFLADSFSKLGIRHHQVWTHDDPSRSLQAALKNPIRKTRIPAHAN